MEKIINRLVKIVKFFLTIGLGFLCVLIFLNTVGRYLFGSILWSVELSRFLYVYLIFIGSAVITLEDGHFAVNLLLNKMPKKFKCIVLIVSKSIVISILYVIFRGSFMLIGSNWYIVTTILKIPYSFFYLVGSIGAGLMILANIYKLYLDIKMLRAVNN